MMSILKDFVKLICGNFDNSEQLKGLNNKNIFDYPYAEHVNNICNDKIVNLPADFEGIFIVEESYYTINGKTRNLHHLFLFVQENEDVKLISYEIPEPYNKSNFIYDNIEKLDYHNLKVSEKFEPAIYKFKNGVWEGGSVSMFSPTTKFKLFEKFSEEKLEVSEIMESNGKKTFGYDIPIIYKKIV